MFAQKNPRTPRGHGWRCSLISNVTTASAVNAFSFSRFHWLDINIVAKQIQRPGFNYHIRDFVIKYLKKIKHIFLCFSDVRRKKNSPTQTTLCSYYVTYLSFHLSLQPFSRCSRGSEILMEIPWRTPSAEAAHYRTRASKDFPENEWQETSAMHRPATNTRSTQFVRVTDMNTQWC